jgi:hypothetical protein|tara:strand:- start:777 stop:1157 length:381 start_codon:yes stop_codon:yes gene_type:complete
MRTDNWKNVERGIARIFGGTRTGSNGESRRDVEHPIFSIEVKHRKSFPDWLHSAYRQADREKEHRIPIVVLHERHTKFEDAYVVIKAEHFCKHYKDIPIQDSVKVVDSSIIETSNKGDMNGSSVYK